MTDQEKLQRLFDAALRDSTPIEKAPTRVVPKASATPPVNACAPAAPETASQPVAMEATFDKKAAEELGVLLDEQIRRKKRKHRVESLVAAVVLIGFTTVSAGWFVQSPERVQALLSAIAEIRSVGDIKAMVAKYDAALKRISARGQQIDAASTAMGVTNKDNGDDPYFDTEMKQMMGGEGKTTGDRAKRMQQAFAKMQEGHGSPAEHMATAGDERETLNDQ